MTSRPKEALDRAEALVTPVAIAALAADPRVEGAWLVARSDGDTVEVGLAVVSRALFGLPNTVLQRELWRLGAGFSTALSRSGWTFALDRDLAARDELPLGYQARRVYHRRPALALVQPPGGGHDE